MIRDPVFAGGKSMEGLDNSKTLVHMWCAVVYANERCPVQSRRCHVTVFLGQDDPQHHLALIPDQAALHASSPTSRRDHTSQAFLQRTGVHWGSVAL